MSGSAQCSCEGVEENLLTSLAWIERVEEGLIFVAIVTGLQMVILQGLAIAYG